MTVKTAFVSMVNSVAGSTGGLYPGLPPAEVALPVKTYRLVSRVDQTDHSGEITYSVCRFQLTIWGDNFAQIDSIGRAMRTFLTGLRDTYGSDVIMTTLPAGEVDMIDPTTGLYKIIQDWFVMHTTGPV